MNAHDPSSSGLPPDVQAYIRELETLNQALLSRNDELARRVAQLVVA
jgi:hypothetical protein